MRFFIGIFSLLLVQQGSAQQVIDLSRTDQQVNVFMQSVGGEPVMLNVKVMRTVEGTPFFRDDWMNCSILMPSGNQYTNVMAKLDLQENDLYYLDKAKKEYIAQSEIREIAFTDAFGRKYRFVHSRYIDATNLKEGWYQWLTDGKASLYKYYDKIASRTKPYGSATEEQTIRTKERYFVVHNKSAVELKKFKDAPDALGNKKEELKNFVSTKGGEIDSADEKYIALINFYNSILQ